MSIRRSVSGNCIQSQSSRFTSKAIKKPGTIDSLQNVQNATMSYKKPLKQQNNDVKIHPTRHVLARFGSVYQLSGTWGEGWDQHHLKIGSPHERRRG